MVGILIRYFSALIVLIAGDALWLSFFAPKVFRPTLGSILLETPRWSAACLFYLLYAVAVSLFAVTPALRADSWRMALVLGALFGFFAYATYDLTNLATIKPWTFQLAAMDVAWGAVITALAALGSYWASSKFSP